MITLKDYQERVLDSLKIKVWFDPEGDFLGVQFCEAPGYMRKTAHEAVMERVDEQGNVLGFTIFGINRFHKDLPLETELTIGQ